MLRPADFPVYLVTDRQQTRGRPLLSVVDQALRGGVRGVQLRERDLTGAALFRLACQLRELTAHFDAALLINDRVDVALACDADGVHLPANSLRVADARRLLGAGHLIAASTHCLSDVMTAAREGADFVALGPVYATPSKLAFGEPIGVEAIAAAAGAVAIPVFAIGGITAGRCAALADSGAGGVALISAILAAEDPQSAARDLVARWTARHR